MKVNSDISPEELKVFLEEAEEQIELLDNAIVRMEKEADNAELMQEIFRAAHTIKGSSGMVGHVRMAELTHAMETMLDKIRNGQLKISSQIVNALLFGLDALKVLKEEVVSQQDADLDIAPIVERLKELTSAEAGANASDASTCNSLELNPLQLQAIKEDLVKEHNIYRIKANVPSDSVWAAVRFMQVLNELNRIGKVVASSPSAKEIEEEKVAFDLEVIFSGLADMDAVQGEVKSVAEIDQVKVVHITEDEIFGKEKAPVQQQGEKQSGAAEKTAQSGNAVQRPPLPQCRIPRLCRACA
jgi:two-component system chemotaxis sensor kinase CheA